MEFANAMQGIFQAIAAWRSAAVRQYAEVPKGDHATLNTGFAFAAKELQATDQARPYIMAKQTAPRKLTEKGFLPQFNSKAKRTPQLDRSTLLCARQCEQKSTTISTSTYLRYNMTTSFKSLQLPQMEREPRLPPSQLQHMIRSVCLPS